MWLLSCCVAHCLSEVGRTKNEEYRDVSSKLFCVLYCTVDPCFTNELFVSINHIDISISSVKFILNGPILMELRFITPLSCIDFLFQFLMHIYCNTVQIRLKTCLSRARQKQILFRRLVSDLLANKVTNKSLCAIWGAR